MINHTQHRLAAFAHKGDRESREAGDEQHLEKIAGDKGVEEGVGNDVQEEGNGVERVRLLRVGLAD